MYFYGRFFVDGDEVLVRPSPPINENSGWTGFWDFGKPWNAGTFNPWSLGSPLAPFDQKVYLLMH